MATSPIPVDRLVARLTALRPEQVRVDDLSALIEEVELDEHSLRPFLNFRTDKYARNLVHRSELFDVIVLCWRPGQLTPVHNHNGQLGWVKLLRGRLEETRYRLASGEPWPDLDALEIDEHGVGHGVKLLVTGHDAVEQRGAVVSVDRERAIHRLGNPEHGIHGEPTVTLHVYSHPHDCCLAFDPDAATCRRVQLAFDSVPSNQRPSSAEAST